jgi:transcriptional regulator with XRE-family HTH domain
MNYLEYRLKANLTQQELAQRTGISRSHMSDVENGVKNPSVKLLLHLSAILDTCPCLLLGCRCSHIE